MLNERQFETSGDMWQECDSITRLMDWAWVSAWSRNQSESVRNVALEGRFPKRCGFGVQSVEVCRKCPMCLVYYFPFCVYGNCPTVCSKGSCDVPATW